MGNHIIPPYGGGGGGGGGGVQNPMTSDLDAGGHIITNIGAGGADLQADGADNVAFGQDIFQALTTGLENTAIGSGPLFNVTSGSRNTAAGFNALGSLQDGVQNSAVGDQALVTTVSGNHNSAVGYRALRLSTGDDNTAVGESAAINLTTGVSNVAVGHGAGAGVTTGGHNVFVGDAAVSAVAAVTRAVVVGDARTAAVDDHVILGASTSPASLTIRAGAPVNGSESNGAFYFRTDGGVGTTMYQARGGVWVNIDATVTNPLSSALDVAGFGLTRTGGNIFIDGQSGTGGAFLVVGKLTNPTVYVVGPDPYADLGGPSNGWKRLFVGGSGQAITAGVGAPVNGSEADGSYYFRSDGGVGTHIYFASGGTWSAII